MNIKQKIDALESRIEINRMSADANKSYISKIYDELQDKIKKLLSNQDRVEAYAKEGDKFRDLMQFVIDEARKKLDGWFDNFLNSKSTEEILKELLNSRDRYYETFFRETDKELLEIRKELSKLRDVFGISK